MKDGYGDMPWRTNRKESSKERSRRFFYIYIWNAHSESCLLLSSNSDKSKCSIMIHHSERHAVGQRTFLPGDCWPWGSWGFAVQNDWRAVNHGAVSGASRNVGSDTWVKHLKKQRHPRNIKSDETDVIMSDINSSLPNKAERSWELDKKGGCQVSFSGTVLRIWQSQSPSLSLSVLALHNLLFKNNQ